MPEIALHMLFADRDTSHESQMICQRTAGDVHGL